MSHPYDASTKYLLQTRLADWLPLIGRTTTAELKVIDADISSVTAAADRVLKIYEDPPWLLHLELQAGRDADLFSNLPAYNILLKRQHGVLVRTVVVLLRKSADWSKMSGTIQEGFAGEPPYLMFRYEVVRVWQLPPEVFLAAGLGLLPLAPLSAVAEDELPSLIRRMDERIRGEASPDEAGKLWTATDVLMGLRYPKQFVSELLQGVHGMKESVTYQAIVEEGRVEGRVEGEIRARQDDLLRLGKRKFGVTTAETESILRSIKEPERLSRMIDALLEVPSWDELLATP